MDDVRSQIRAELTAQLQAQYQAELNAALAQQESKLNAAETADRATMRQELTAEITKELQAGCLTFDDGSYFCVNPADASGTYPAPATYFRAYAAADPQSGYQEIFIQDSGTVTEITKSNYDNIQPVWANDRSLVAWQGLVNDRWQIFLYDRSTGATKMLSGGASNNINPAIDGNRVAWQGWDGGNWQIYLAEPTSTGGWQTTKITNDQWANIEPQMAGGLLAWQAYRDGSWQIFVDDLLTGNISQVSKGSSANTDPRFVLTWNSSENGKAQALQYDIATGAVSPLGSAPAPAAVPIPQSPSTKNSATLPVADGSSSSTTSATSTKPQKSPTSSDPIPE